MRTGDVRQHLIDEDKRIWTLMGNYNISVQMNGTPSLWCQRKKTLIGSVQMPCWVHVFDDFYDDPFDLTLARLFQLAREHEKAAHS